MAGGACCTLSKCCFCCIELRMGVVIVSCINLVVSSFLFAFWVWGTYETRAALEKLATDEAAQQKTPIIYVIAFFWISAITAVVEALAVPLDIMLLAGVINARRRLLQAWLVGFAIVYCTYVLLMVLLMICFMDQAIEISFFLIIQTALEVYFWVVVRSYHVQLGYQNGEVPRTTAGRVYNAVAMGDVAPPVPGRHGHGYGYNYNYTGSVPRSYTGGVPRPPAKPPQYVDSELGQ